MSDIWHFRREQLARDVVSMFNSGMSHALTFFAPRRKGKTEFLQQDLVPAAEEKGWKPLYYSFMEGDEAEKPRGFILALQAASAGTGVLARVSAKLKASLPGVGEGEVALAPGQTADEPLRISQLIGRLGEKAPTLLLLDEVQELAGREENKALIAGLRTGLDMHKDRVKVVFTGSSREKLRRMFASSAAPFFHFGANLPFPDLERDFVIHIAGAYHRTTGRQLDEEVLWQAFLKFDRTPAYLRESVEQFVLNPLRSLESIVADKLAQIPDDRQFDDTWAGLNPLDQAILIELARMPQRIYPADFRKRVSARIHAEEITSSAMQVAINKLASRNMVFKDGANYAIEDEHLREWIEALEKQIP